MLICKQEERNLKRVEGDIIRKESNLKVAMRNYENGNTVSRLNCSKPQILESQGSVR